MVSTRTRIVGHNDVVAKSKHAPRETLQDANNKTPSSFSRPLTISYGSLLGPLRSVHCNSTLSTPNSSSITRSTPCKSHETQISTFCSVHETMDDESQEQRYTRIRSLWDKLDVQNEGALDVKALKRGLKKLDHREDEPLLSTSHN